MKSHTLINKKIEVEEDIIEITEYYLTISSELAERFLNQLEKAEEAISRQPQGFEVKYKNVRTFLLKSFPYHIHYIIDNQNIVVIAVAHAKQENLDYSNRL